MTIQEIKQYPTKITIYNPGGFPKGVNLSNLLTVSSTPRSRLMTEVLEKTGLVERSGQGVDKIFSFTLAEGKAIPNYNNSDLLQVELTIETEIKDKAFHVFINQYMTCNRKPKLGADHILALYEIKEHHQYHGHEEIVEDLVKAGLIHNDKLNQSKFRLSKEYVDMAKEFLAEESENIFSEDTENKKSKMLHETSRKILTLIIQNNTITKKELSEKLNVSTTTIHNHLKQLTQQGFIQRKGKTRAAYWVVIKNK